MLNSKTILLLVSFLTLFGCKTQEKIDYGYEMVCQGVGIQGSNLVKVYSYGKTVDKAIEESKKNAVRGILFKGIVGGNGCSRQPAIVSYQEHQKHKTFFENFFKGEYLRFVHLTSNGSVSPKDRLKVGKYYKIGVIISVDKTNLRKYLEERKIIKKLGSIFD